MVDKKTVVQLVFNGDVESLLKEINDLMADASRKPDLIYVKLSTLEFPNRNLDLPEKLR